MKGPRDQAPALRHLRHFIRRIPSRPALRQAIGVLVLALFARQTVAMAWMMGPAADAKTASSAAVATTASSAPHAAHHHMPSAPNAPAAPRHSSGCDGTAPAACCALGSGCIAVVVLPPVVWAAPRLAFAGVIGAAATSPLWRDIAPADPPPRA
jgi:hypothetical protein